MFCLCAAHDVPAESQSGQLISLGIFYRMSTFLSFLPMWFQSPFVQRNQMHSTVKTHLLNAFLQAASA